MAQTILRSHLKKILRSDLQNFLSQISSKKAPKNFESRISKICTVCMENTSPCVTSLCCHLSAFDFATRRDETRSRRHCISVVRSSQKLHVCAALGLVCCSWTLGFLLPWVRSRSMLHRELAFVRSFEPWMLGVGAVHCFCNDYDDKDERTGEGERAHEEMGAQRSSF